MDHTYREHHITATALWLSDSDRWTSSIVISTSDGTSLAVGYPGRLVFFDSSRGGMGRSSLFDEMD
jgi:hypothetical protein